MVVLSMPSYTQETVSIPSIEEGEILKLRTEAYAAHRALDAKDLGNVFTDKVYFTSPYGQRASNQRRGCSDA